MAGQDRDPLRDAAEHVARTRIRIAEGAAEIERQRAVLHDTERHLTGMSRWLEQTERQLGEQRARREPDGDDHLPSAA